MVPWIQPTIGQPPAGGLPLGTNKSVVARVVPPSMAGMLWVSSLAEPCISAEIACGWAEISDTVMGWAAVTAADG